MVLSVVVACYDQARELKVTLLSFLNQAYPHGQYELLVIDDHSPNDNSRLVVRELRVQYPSANLHYVRLFRNDGGAYGSSARCKNVGLRLALGDYVYFNNAEIVQAGETLTVIADAMGACTAPICLRGRVLDCEFENVSGLSPSELAQLYDITDPKRERVASADHAGLAVAARRDYLAVGGIDERFDYWGKEDLDLAARLKRHGLAYVYDSSLKSFHVHHPPRYVKQGHYRRMCSLFEQSNRTGIIEANLGTLWGVIQRRPANELAGTVVLEAADDHDDLRSRLFEACYSEQACTWEVLVVCRETDGEATEELLRTEFRGTPWCTLADDEADLSRVLAMHVRTRKIAWFEQYAPFRCPDWELAERGRLVLIPPHAAFPHESATVSGKRFGWLAERTRAKTLPVGPIDPQTATPTWCVEPQDKCTETPVVTTSSDLPLHSGSRVLAIVPYFDCEEYLEQCLESLTRQSHPLAGIVVIDDASPQSPVELVRKFPTVTLLGSTENCGPYRHAQQVIDDTNYDGYLFHDADDFSSLDRLDVLLRYAERNQAELVGSQEVRIDLINNVVRPVLYPLDVNQALADRPGHPLLHPTSVVSRALVIRTGGFATGLRFGADTEFLLRAVHVGRIVNCPEYLYFHRKRPRSLTTDPETGLESPARVALLAAVKERARANIRLKAEGREPDLSPILSAPPIQLTKLVGPPMEMRSSSVAVWTR